jgi:hypothetical protein
VLLDLGALGDRDDDVLTAVAVLALALAVRAALGCPVRVVLEGDQRRDVVVDDEPHVPAGAPVAAVGTALGGVRLPPERHRARAAIATLDMQPTLIDELRHPCRLRVWAWRTPLRP